MRDELQRIYLYNDTGDYLPSVSVSSLDEASIFYSLMRDMFSSPLKQYSETLLNELVSNHGKKFLTSLKETFKDHVNQGKLTRSINNFRHSRYPKTVYKPNGLTANQKAHLYSYLLWKHGANSPFVSDSDITIQMEDLKKLAGGIDASHTVWPVPFQGEVTCPFCNKPAFLKLYNKTRSHKKITNYPFEFKCEACGHTETHGDKDLRFIDIEGVERRVKLEPSKPSRPSCDCPGCIQYRGTAAKAFKEFYEAAPRALVLKAFEWPQKEIKETDQTTDYARRSGRLTYDGWQLLKIISHKKTITESLQEFTEIDLNEIYYSGNKGFTKIYDTLENMATTRAIYFVVDFSTIVSLGDAINIFMRHQVHLPEDMPLAERMKICPPLIENHHVGSVNRYHPFGDEAQYLTRRLLLSDKKKELKLLELYETILDLVPKAIREGESAWGGWIDINGESIYLDTAEIFDNPEVKAVEIKYHDYCHMVAPHSMTIALNSTYCENIPEHIANPHATNELEPDDKMNELEEARDNLFLVCFKRPQKIVSNDEPFYTESENTLYCAIRNQDHHRLPQNVELLVYARPVDGRLEPYQTRITLDVSKTCISSVQELQLYVQCTPQGWTIKRETD